MAVRKVSNSNNDLPAKVTFKVMVAHLTGLVQERFKSDNANSVKTC